MNAEREESGEWFTHPADKGEGSEEGYTITNRSRTVSAFLYVR